MAKPKGWRAFDALAKRLAGVDKVKVDKKIAADKGKRIKKRKKNERSSEFFQFTDSW